MDILLGIGLILLSVVVLIIAAIVFGTAGFFLFHILFRIWPFALGLIACIVFWRSGHDNLGIVVLLAAIVANVFTIQRSDELAIELHNRLAKKMGDWGKTTDSDGYHDPMEGKTKTYDSEGNVTGYIDKD